MNKYTRSAGRGLTFFVMVTLLLIYQTGVFGQTPANDQTLPLTPATTEGPYWKAGSPLRDTLYGPNDSGKRITVSGRVLDSLGKTVAGATIDVWQADAGGAYDNTAFRYRGHVVSDAQGQYRFMTVIPGEYPGRTPHVHIKVITGDGRSLTTQLYFPELATRNNRDNLYNELLVVTWKSDANAVFDFVIRSR